MGVSEAFSAFSQLRLKTIFGYEQGYDMFHVLLWGLRLTG
jgi:hypothetical protein